MDLFVEGLAVHFAVDAGGHFIRAFESVADPLHMIVATFKNEMVRGRLHQLEFGNFLSVWRRDVEDIAAAKLEAKVFKAACLSVARGVTQTDHHAACGRRPALFDK